MLAASSLSDQLLISEVSKESVKVSVPFYTELDSGFPPIWSNRSTDDGACLFRPFPYTFSLTVEVYGFASSCSTAGLTVLSQSKKLTLAG